MSQEYPCRNITLHRDVLEKITAGIKTSSDIKGGLYQKQQTKEETIIPRKK